MRVGRRFVASLVLLVCSARAASITDAALLKYVGGIATGETLDTLAYTMTVLANKTEAVISLSFKSACSKTGWYGWGLGE